MHGSREPPPPHPIFMQGKILFNKTFDPLYVHIQTSYWYAHIVITRTPLCWHSIAISPSVRLSLYLRSLVQSISSLPLAQFFTNRVPLGIECAMTRAYSQVKGLGLKSQQNYMQHPFTGHIFSTLCPIWLIPHGVCMVKGSAVTLKEVCRWRVKVILDHTKILFPEHTVYILSTQPTLAHTIHTKIF